MKKNKNWWHTKITSKDKNLLIKTISKNKFTQGSVVIQVEKMLSNIFHKPAILTPNGTTAILMSLMSLNLKKDDEILVANFGWIASLQPVLFLNLKFKLLDVSSDIPNINLEIIKKNVSKKTKAVIFVHFHGHMNNISEISKFCKKKKIFLIEDSCKALLSKDAKGQIAGSFGDFGCFSTGMISLISSGYGGFIILNNKKYEKSLRLIKDHGCRRGLEKYPVNGLNFKNSDVLSSLLINQIKNVKSKINKLKHIYNLYKKIDNPNIKILSYKKNEVPLCIDLFSKKISKVKITLDKNHIPFMCLHKPFHKAEFLKMKKKPFFFNSEKFYRNSLMLPCGPDQNLNLIKKTIKVLNKI